MSKFDSMLQTFLFAKADAHKTGNNIPYHDAYNELVHRDMVMLEALKQIAQSTDNKGTAYYARQRLIEIGEG
jgi:hypothetical protein